MTSPVEIKVEIPGKPYSVWVGSGLLEQARDLIPFPERMERWVLFADGNVLGAAERIQDGYAAKEVIHVPESSKTMSEAARLSSALVRHGLHRDDMVVGLGGGAVGDLTGFVAATYHRGIAFGLMPTTLLAMVDASIGGKTAVNLPEGKNLVGAFHQPSFVISDVSTLATLPAAELSSGLAEVAKHGLIDDVEILGMLRGGRDAEAMTRLVARAAAVKARIVAEDETERGRRAFLNYGHTLGHALETLGGYTRWRHGEAVAIGMHFAARLAASLGYADRVDEHLAVLEACGLPVRGADYDFDAVLGAMAHDKKYRGGIRFVVLEDLGRPVLKEHIPEELLRRAYDEVRG